LSEFREQLCHIAALTEVLHMRAATLREILAVSQTQNSMPRSATMEALDFSEITKAQRAVLDTLPDNVKYSVLRNELRILYDVVPGRLHETFWDKTKRFFRTTNQFDLMFSSGLILMGVGMMNLLFLSLDTRLEGLSKTTPTDVTSFSDTVANGLLFIGVSLFGMMNMFSGVMFRKMKR
jgi:hypothetical protein